MKKTVSLLLTLLLVLTSFTVSAFAFEKTKTEQLFDSFEERKELTVSFRTGRGKTFGDSYSAVNTVYLKGEKVAYDLNNGTVTVRTIADGDSFVSYILSFPFIHMKAEELPFGDFDFRNTVKGLSDFTMNFLVFVNSYETEIDGVNYYVEEFSDRGSVINSFFYVDDELKVLKAQDFAKDTVQYTYFDKVSLSADEGVFEMPEISFNLTLLMKWLISLLIR